MHIRNILIILAILLIIPVCTAEVSTIYGKQLNCVNLPQTCNNCTFVNVTNIKLPNQTIIYINKQMSKNGNDYNYTFCQTDLLGTYYIQTCGDADGYSPCYSPPPYILYVNGAGTELSNGQSLIYAVLIIINLVIFIICLYAGISIDGSNSPDEDGKVLPNYKKYLKIFFLFLTYIMIIWFSFNLWQLSLNYLQTSFTTNFFYSVFNFLLVALIPVTIIFMILIFVQLFTDKKFRDMWERGIPAYRNYGDF